MKIYFMHKAQQYHNKKHFKKQMLFKMSFFWDIGMYFVHKVYLHQVTRNIINMGTRVVPLVEYAIHVEESQHKSVMTSDVSWFKLHEPFELVEEEA